MKLSTSVELRWMLDPCVSQNVSHLVRSSLNILGISLGSFILLLLVSVLLGEGILPEIGNAVGTSVVLLQLSGGSSGGVLGWEVIGLDFDEINCSTPQIDCCSLFRSTLACSITSLITLSSTNIKILSSSDCSLANFLFKESFRYSSLLIAGPPVTVLASSTWCISLVHS